MKPFLTKLGVLGLLIIIGLVIYFYQFTTTKLYPGKIIIGAVQWPGYLGLYIADDKGYFQDAGLDVDVVNWPSLSEQDENYIAKKSQGSANLTLTAVNEAYQGVDHKIVVVIDYSNGSDGIIASPNIKTISEARGKRVAFEHGTLEEFFLRYALDRYGINFNDIIPINLTPEKSAEAVVAGTADIGITYEPFMSKAVATGRVRKIYSSKDTPGLITDVLTFHSDFIDQYPETVQAIVKAYFRGVQFWEDYPEEANRIIAKRLDAAPDEIPLQIEGLIIPDEKENKVAFTFAAGPESLYGNLRSIGKFIQQIRGVKTRLDTDNLIDSRSVRSLNQ